MSQPRLVMPDFVLEAHITELLGLAMPEWQRRKLEEVIAELHELREPILERMRGSDRSDVSMLDVRIRIPKQVLVDHVVQLRRLEMPEPVQLMLENVVAELVDLRARIEPSRVHIPPAEPLRTQPPPTSGARLHPLEVVAATTPHCSRTSAARAPASRVAPPEDVFAYKRPENFAARQRSRVVGPSDHLPKGFDAVTREQRALFENHVVPGIPPVVDIADFLCAPRAAEVRFFNALLYATFNVVVVIPSSSGELVRHEFHPNNFLVHVLLPGRGRNRFPISKIWWRGRIVDDDTVRVHYETPHRCMPQAAERELIAIWRARAALNSRRR